MVDPITKQKQLKETLASTLPEEALNAQGIKGRINQEATIDDDKPTAATLNEDAVLIETSSELLLETPHLGAKAQGVLAEEIEFENRYQMKSLLGKGGMGKVYEFHDLNLKREVAIKAMKNPGTANNKHIASLINEARVTASLEHSGVLPVHDLDFTESGEIYYTMRKVEGMSLGDAIEKLTNGEDVEEIATLNDRINIMLKVCDTLELAHRQSILHRDIKPENIMLGQFGEVFVVDWGTALILSEESANKANRVGTPIFMSPEQSRREGPSIQNEIYSLGATLFQLLFLRFHMFTERLDEFWEHKKIGHIDPISDEERQRIPGPLLAIILKALAADPKDRYQSAEDLAKDLRSFQAGMAVSAFTDTAWGFMLRWYKRNKRLVMIALIMMIPIIALLALGWNIISSVNEERERRWELVFEDTFDRKEIGANWKMDAGRGDIIDNNLVISGDAGVEARLLIPHDPIVRFEFQARVPPGYNACDMSAYMFTTPGKLDSFHEPSGYLFGFGVGNNERSVLRRAGHIMVSRNDVLIEPGKWHTVVCEKDSTSVKLFIDGEEALAVEDHYPPRFDEEMHALIYTWKSQLEIRYVKLYSKTVAQRARIIDIADEFFWSGQHAAAARLFETVWKDHQGSPLGASALFGLALCHAEQEQIDEAVRLLEMLVNEPGAEALKLTAQLKIAELYIFNDKFAEGLELAQQVVSKMKPIESYSEAMIFFEAAFEELISVCDKTPGGLQALDDYCKWWHEVFPQHVSIADGRYWHRLADSHRKCGDWKGYERVLREGIADPHMLNDKLGLRHTLFSVEWQGIWTEDRLEKSKQPGFEKVYLEMLVCFKRLEEVEKITRTILDDKSAELGLKESARLRRQQLFESTGNVEGIKRMWGDNIDTKKGQISLAIALMNANRGKEAVDVLKLDWKEIEGINEHNRLGREHWRMAFLAFCMSGNDSAVRRIQKIAQSLHQQEVKTLYGAWYHQIIGGKRSAESMAIIERSWSDGARQVPWLVTAELARLNGDRELARSYYEKVVALPFSTFDNIAAHRLKALKN